MNKGICILLASYNGEKYIKTQLDSLLSQTMKPQKILVSDDSSTDSTMDIISEYAVAYPNIIAILKKDIPCGNARDNFLFLAENCNYEYAMFCDQDDVWHSDKIEKTYAEMQRLEQEYGKDKPLLVHTDLCVVDNSLEELCPSFAKYSDIDISESRFASLLVQNVVTGCTMMVNSRLLEYSRRAKEHSGILMHDWWFALIASAFGKKSAIAHSTIDYRQHGDNSVGAADVKKLSYVAKKATDSNGIKGSLAATVKQAESFYKSFKDIDDKNEAIAISKEYSQILKLSKLKRLSLLKKHGLYKQGFKRKLAQCIFI